VQDEDLAIVSKLNTLDLSWNAHLTNQCFGFVAHTLRSLNLCCAANITDEGVSLLTNLTDLNLAQNKHITNDCVSLLTKLRILNLESNPSISDEGISNLTGLTSLNLTDNHRITVSALNRMSMLQDLDLTRNYLVNLENATPATFPWITSLTSLNLQRAKRNIITDVQFQHLSESLLQLNLLGCNWGSYSNAGISVLTRLRSLNLSYNSVVSDVSLSCLVSLSSLNLSNNSSITDSSLMFLRNLTFLNLDRNNNITSASIKFLSKLDQLRLSSYSCTNYLLFMKMHNSQ
jgi:hypothetical protein